MRIKRKLIIIIIIIIIIMVIAKLPMILRRRRQITQIITQFIVIDIAPLMVLFKILISIQNDCWLGVINQ